MCTLPSKKIFLEFVAYFYHNFWITTEARKLPILFKTVILLHASHISIKILNKVCNNSQLRKYTNSNTGARKTSFLEATITKHGYCIWICVRHILQTFLGLISRLNFSGPYGMKNYTLSKTADVSLRLWSAFCLQGTILTRYSRQHVENRNKP